MSTNEVMVSLDTFGIAAAGWIGTWLVHGVLLCALALVLGRLLRTGAFREQLYKVALVGAFVTTGAQAIGVGVGPGWRVELAGPTSAGREIGISGAVALPQSALPELATLGRRVAEPAPAKAAEVGPVARWRWAHTLPIAALVTAMIGAAGLLRDRRRIRLALAGRRAVERADWRDDLDELAARAGLRDVPRLSCSTSLNTPVALARGELVVPERALDELDRDARRALLAHELAHLARRDPAWLIATGVLERIGMLQVMQRPVRRRLVDEMELACDAQAVLWIGKGLPLARCLERVASWLAPGIEPLPIASMAARDSALVRRVQLALAPATAPTTSAQRRVFCLSVATAVALLACSGPTVEGQAVDEPEEAAEQPPALGDGVETAGGWIIGTWTTPTLVFGIDGSMYADGELIHDPETGSFEALDAYLAELVATMETRPIDPTYPDGHKMAMGELVLYGTGDAPMRGFQKVMEHCGTVGLWRLRFASDAPGGKQFYDVPLPVDLGAIPEAIEEVTPPIELIGSELAPPKVEVTMRLLVEGDKLDPQTGHAWSGSGPFVYGGSRRVQYQLPPQKKTTSLDEIRHRLETLRADWPDAGLLIDARPGIVYGEVIAVMDAARAAGFDKFTFVGAYD